MYQYNEYGIGSKCPKLFIGPAAGTNAGVGYVGRHQLMRGNIEGRAIYIYLVGSCPPAESLGDLLRASLLDYDIQM